MLATTQIYDKYQTVIPVEIRKKLNIDRNYFIEWDINEDGVVELNFVKKLTLDEMVGKYETKKPINSLELKQKFKNGELR